MWNEIDHHFLTAPIPLAFTTRLRVRCFTMPSFLKPLYVSIFSHWSKIAVFKHCLLIDRRLNYLRCSSNLEYSLAKNAVMNLAHISFSILAFINCRNIIFICADWVDVWLTVLRFLGSAHYESNQLQSQLHVIHHALKYCTVEDFAFIKVNNLVSVMISVSRNVMSSPPVMLRLWH